MFGLIRVVRCNQVYPKLQCSTSTGGHKFLKFDPSDCRSFFECNAGGVDPSRGQRGYPSKFHRKRNKTNNIPQIFPLESLILFVCHSVSRIYTDSMLIRRIMYSYFQFMWNTRTKICKGKFLSVHYACEKRIHRSRLSISCLRLHRRHEKVPSANFSPRIDR